MKDKEPLQRLNFLYQAAHCVLAKQPQNLELVRFYGFTQRTIARRLVLRQDPSVKRSQCRKCFCLLIPGLTATVRQRRKKQRSRFTVMRCLSCGHSKSLLNDPTHKLWVDQPEAQLEQQGPQDQQQGPRGEQQRPPDAAAPPAKPQKGPKQEEMAAPEQPSTSAGT